MNKLRACLAVSGALLLIGVFSQSAHAQGDARVTPPPGRALVFVFRSDREAGAAQVPVTVNAEAVGQLANGTFLVATVNPGRTFVRTGDRVLSAVAFQAEPNRSYFVRVEAVSVRTETRLVGEAEGRSSLAQSRLAGGAAPAVIAAPRSVPSAPKPPPAPQIAKPAPPRAVKPAAAARAPAPAASNAWDTAIMVKAGSFKMANANQMVGGDPSSYDTTSKPVFGVELEWRSRAGLALGGEVFYYENDLINNVTTQTAQQKVLTAMLNGKYYFRAANWFYPFVGAGIGFAGAVYGGGFTGRATGLAYQGLGGVEFRFSGVGLFGQFKYLAATIDDDANTKVKIGGSGVLAGVSIIF